MWVFEEDADVQIHDIMLLDDLGLALAVDRVAEFTWLTGGDFHHYEILTSEHEKGYDALAALVA